jgi:hypothetical protein
MSSTLFNSPHTQPNWLNNSQMNCTVPKNYSCNILTDIVSAKQKKNYPSRGSFSCLVKASTTWQNFGQLEEASAEQRKARKL